MAYLVVRKVKGNYYLYRQESYREGGKVRTRTVAYLGAVDSATAQIVQSIRRKLASADQRALVRSVKAAVSAQTLTEAHRDAQEAFQGSAPQNDEARPQKASETVTIMLVNGRRATVDTATGEILSDFEFPDAATDANASPVVRTEEVITTGFLKSSAPNAAANVNAESAAEPLRPFHRAINFPDDIEQYGVSKTALVRTHQRFGRRLESLQINAANMPDVRIKYGHPDCLRRERDGSYTVQASRTPKARFQPINKAKLWTHYRQALASGYLDVIERRQPERFHALQIRLDHSHAETRRMLFEHIRYAATSLDRLKLSLQLYLWDRLPKDHTQAANPQEHGQIDFSTLGDWRAESAFIIAEAQKNGWQGLKDKTKQSRAKLKSAITKRRNWLKDAGFFQRLGRKISGRERRTLREIIEREKSLAANTQLDKRIAILQEFVGETKPPPKPSSVLNRTRRKMAKIMGTDVVPKTKDLFYSHSQNTDETCLNIKKDGWHYVFNLDGELIDKHKD